MKRTLRIAFIAFFGMLPELAVAQSPQEVGLLPEELVVAGFTTTTAGLVVGRLDDQDVSDAWAAVVSTRSALAEAQNGCLQARIALRSSPADSTCQQAAASSQSSLQSSIFACETAVAAFEGLLFDQVDGSLLTELRRVRGQHAANLPPEMLALDWNDDAMAALSAAIVEERRCQRREEEVGAASATLLSNARSDSAVVAAAARLQTYLPAVISLLDSVE